MFSTQPISCNDLRFCNYAFLYDQFLNPIEELQYCNFSLIRHEMVVGNTEITELPTNSRLPKSKVWLSDSCQSERVFIVVPGPQTFGKCSWDCYDCCCKLTLSRSLWIDVPCHWWQKISAHPWTTTKILPRKLFCNCGIRGNKCLQKICIMFECSIMDDD